MKQQPFSIYCEKFRLKQFFTGVAHNCIARRVAQANQLVPAGCISRVVRPVRGARIDRRRKRDRHVARPWQVRSIAQKFPRPRKRNGKYRRAGRHSRFECAQLEWPHAVFSCKRPFRENENRLAVAQKLFDFLSLSQARLRIRPTSIFETKRYGTPSPSMSGNTSK